MADFPDIGFSLPDFGRMCELYAEWNARINVVSRKDIDNLYSRHIRHSLCIALYLSRCREDEYRRWLAPDGGVSVLDAGCGGGFPGIPLAYCFPSVRFTLCDSIGKKIKVASEVASALGLRNVTCLNCRMEELTGKWDYAVSRAVTSLDRLDGWLEGKYTERLLCLKGGDLTAELEAFASHNALRRDVSVWELEPVLQDACFASKAVVDVSGIG